MSNNSNQTTRLGRTIIFAFAAIFALTVCASAQSKSSTAHLNSTHAKALQTWLKANPKYRAAQVADCKNKFGLKSMRGDDAKFHPYYAVYDYDKDETEDFAVVVIEANRKPDFQYTLLIFKGDKQGNYKMAKTIDSMDLRQGGIWLNVMEEGITDLYIGEFQTDNCSYLQWSNKKFVIRDCEGN
ncbi:MAG: hypothetical protein M3R14_14095 [Acidobacteriota bacterium]|nr:hypothetical protein [Acidobacteriota bacterium]